MTNPPNTPAPGTTSPPTTPATPTDDAIRRLRYQAATHRVRPDIGADDVRTVLDELDQARDDRTAYYARIERARHYLSSGQVLGGDGRDELMQILGGAR